MGKTKGAKNIQWNDVQSDIQRMYVDQRMKLEDIRTRLKATKNFNASTRSYRSKINEWGLKKGSSSQTSTRKKPSDPTSSDVIETSRPSLLTLSLGSKGSEDPSNSNEHSFGILNIGSFPGPLTMFPGILSQTRDGAPTGLYSDGPLWQVIDHIKEKRVAELRMLLDITLANETIPVSPAHPRLWRIQDRYCGRTLLCWAVATSSVEVVKALLDAGANVNTQSRLGSHRTPLMAAITRSTTLVKLLLMWGASTEPMRTDGLRALSIAARDAQDPQIVQLILEKTLHYPWNDRLSALDLALLRRHHDFGTFNHEKSTCVARILITADRTTVAHSRSFFESWTKRRDWLSLINEDEKRSVVHLIGHGADLHQSFAPHQVRTSANLAHTLLHHCWEVDMPKFLAQNLGTMFPRSAAGGELLRALASGCTSKCSHRENIAEAMSAFLENGVDPESQDTLHSRTPLVLWIMSLNRLASRTKIENSLPSLAVLLKWGANPNRKISTYPIEDLLKQDWMHRFPDIAINILEMLLSHFSDDTNPKPPWQCPPYFPISEDFGTYDLGGLVVFKQLTKGRISDKSSDLLFKAVYAVSAKKFLASQLSTSTELRAFDKIQLIVKDLRNLGVSLDGFPKDFYLDTIVGLTAIPSQQESVPSRWSYASESYLLPLGCGQSTFGSTEG